MRRDGVPVLVQAETAGPLLLSSLTPVLRPSSAPRLRLPGEEAHPAGARVLALLLLALLVVLAAGCRRKPAVPEIPEGCRGEAGVRVYRGADRAARLRCALAFARYGCAFGDEPSCEMLEALLAAAVEADRI